MKIALNIEWVGARRGGAEKYAGTLARSLAAAGHEVHLYARGVDAGETPPSAAVHEVQVSDRPGLGWSRALRFAAASEQALKRDGFDLIVGFNKTWHQDVYLAVAGAHPAAVDCGLARFRHPITRRLHALGKRLNLKQHTFQRIERRQFASDRRMHIVAPSQFSARHFRDYHGVPNSQITVIPHGIELTSESSNGAAVRLRFREQHNLAPNDVAILFTARNYALKGLEPLLESFAVVARNRPQARLIVCGSRRDGAYRRQAARLGIADRVEFLGFVNDVQACFAGCDVFAFPTFYDPCSLVVPEALHHGLPVITTRQNGAAELMTHGTHGFVLDSPWHLDDLARHLAALVDNQDWRVRMSLAARQRAAACTMDVRLRELTTLFERLAASHFRKTPIAASPLRRAA